MFPDIHFELEYIVIGPQGVCEDARVTATHQGRWLDHEPTGERLEWRNAIFFPRDPAARRFKGASTCLYRLRHGAARNPLTRIPSARIPKRASRWSGPDGDRRCGGAAPGGVMSPGRRRETDRNASTTAGLNCFPRPAWISSIAASMSRATA